MSESERLATQLERGLTGGAWHGPSWKEILDGLGRDDAVRRPVAGAHTIAEIAHHTATWNEVVRRRLDGESPQVADAENWPTTDPADDAAWDAVTARLFASGKALVRRIRTFPPERLDERRPGLEGTWFEMIAGVLQHVLYHAGQAALLRKGAGNG